MLRTLRNIAILLLIGILSSGIPIYASSFNFNAFIPTIISNDNPIIVSTEENIISPNHVQIKYEFSADSNESYINLLFDKDNPFTVELISADNSVQNLHLDDIVPAGNYKSIEIYSGNPVYIIFDFDQKKLDLPNGSYSLKIKPNTQNSKIEIDEYEFDINFNTKGKYIPALSAAHIGTALTLYFPDNDSNYLIPVTRFVPYTTSPLTVTLRALEKGPDTNLGLPLGSPIPFGGKAGKVGDTAYINLPTNLNNFNQGSSSSNIAVHSLVNSLTSINGISNVQFQFNGKTLKEAFHGITTDEPFYSSESAMIYTGYLSNTDRFLLAPVPFNMFGAQYNDNNIETIFDTMKFKAIPEIYNSQRHPLIPNKVDLLDYSFTNDKLTLTFNEEFINVYENDPERHQMMVDGIIFTFKSLKEVNYIDIKVKMNSNGQVKNYDFTPPIYINPEN